MIFGCVGLGLVGIKAIRLSMATNISTVYLQTLNRTLKTNPCSWCCTTCRSPSITEECESVIHTVMKNGSQHDSKLNILTNCKVRMNKTHKQEPPVPH